MTLVANQFLRTPPSTLIRMIQVPGSFDEADKYIAAHVTRRATWWFTADIPLAADVVARGAALSPRSLRALYRENIRGRLRHAQLRGLLRNTGVDTAGRRHSAPGTGRPSRTAWIGCCCAPLTDASAHRRPRRSPFVPFAHKHAAAVAAERRRGHRVIGLAQQLLRLQVALLRK